MGVVSVVVAIVGDGIGVGFGHGVIIVAVLRFLFILPFLRYSCSRPPSCSSSFLHPSDLPDSSRSKRT